MKGIISEADVKSGKVQGYRPCWLYGRSHQRKRTGG
ncbi:hypothetical protein HTZ85_09960 [Escherichia coli]|nr:hypothetical protein [Escherichia coli]